MKIASNYLHRANSRSGTNTWREGKKSSKRGYKGSKDAMQITLRRFEKRI